MGWLIAALVVIGAPIAWLLLVARRDRRPRASSADPYANKDGGIGAGQPHFAQPMRDFSGGDSGVSRL